MNSVIEAQASRLAELRCEENSMSCHLFLDTLNIPLDIQDRILSEMAKLKTVDTGNIARVIDNCYDN